MIMDALLLLSSAQAVTTTAVSTNVLDMLNARDIGVGEPIKIAASVGTAFAGGTSLQVQVQSSADNSTWVTMDESRAYITADLTAGAKIANFTLPARSTGEALPRYYRFNYVVVGTMTAGTVNAALVLDRPNETAYPAGVNVYN